MGAAALVSHKGALLDDDVLMVKGAFSSHLPYKDRPVGSMNLSWLDGSV